MNVLTKVLRGDQVRPTRLHTEAGEYCGVAALPDAMFAIWSWTRQKLTGSYSVKPWWVYQAIRDVESALRSSDKVLEVGGGFSTLWLGQRCHSVCSIEESNAWADIVANRARDLHISNVEMLSGDSRTLFSRQIVAGDWDVVVIDGPRDRFKIFRDLLASSKRPRLIIYDDTDKTENRPALTMRVPHFETKTYRGFKPQTLHACETTVFLYRP